MLDGLRPNGERYPLVGGTRCRRFDGTSFEPKKPLENAASPTSRVHTVLGCVFVCQYFLPFQQRLEGPEVVLHESCVAGKLSIIHLGLPK